MIEIRQVAKTYADFELQVSFQGPDSGILVLLGASGSGKTTTLRMIAGFEKPDSGEILLDGQDITHLPVQKRRIGVVFQDYALFPHLSVWDNIAYGLRAQGYDKKSQQNRVDELMELTGLQGFGHRSITTLSGGEQQRVALARALAPEPRALLLDEPFSAVDPERRQELGSYLVRIQKQLNIPMIFVTHSRQEAMALGSIILLLSQGRVVESGSPFQLYRKPRSIYGAKFLGSCSLYPRDQWEQIGIILQGREPGTYMVRPEHVEFLSVQDQPETGVSATPKVTPPHSPPQASGIIQEKTFSGPGWEYQLEFPVGLVQVFSSLDLPLGQQVQIRIAQEHLVLLSD